MFTTNLDGVKQSDPVLHPHEDKKNGMEWNGVCVCVCVRVRVRVRVCVCVPVHVCVHVCFHFPIEALLSPFVHMCHVCVHELCVCVCLCACVHVCTVFTAIATR